MRIESILNYRPVSDRITSSGQPHGKEFRTIAENGFLNIINLAMPDSENALDDEGYRITALGMSYFHIPVPFDTPLPRHLYQFCQLMEVLKDEKVWVHCAKNYRASAFLYQYYRLILKKDEASSLAVMLPEWQPNKVWREFMLIDSI